MSQWKDELPGNILYEDESLIVFHKPAGIPVQSAKVGSMDLESALKNYLVQKGGKPYLGVIHRLDQPVEGIVVFAKTQLAAKELSRQIANNEMQKEYLAVVCNVPKERKGTLTDELEKDAKTNTSKVVLRKTAKSKQAVLDYEVMKERDNMALLSILLHTGRHHQIRVQMAHAGIPLLGDTKYNKDAANGKGRQQIALCANRLTFIHPKTRKQFTYAIQPTGENFLGFI